MRRWLVGLGVTLLFGAQPIWALDPKETLEKAVQDYQEALNTVEADLRLERFKRAQRLFSQVIDERKIKNADIYVNLGNAALQAREIGAAILAYRRALEVQPGHRRARQNLDHARGLLPEWVPRPRGQSLFDTFFFWQSALSQSARSLAAALSFALAGLLLAVAIRWRWPWARGWGWVVCPCGRPGKLGELSLPPAK